MSLRNFIWRVSQKTNSCAHDSPKPVVCDTPELQDIITSWTRNEKWKFGNFADFIELIGIPLPVKLSNLNPKTNSFQCNTATNTNFSIFLYFGDGLEHCSEIHVFEEDQTRIYNINSNIEDGITVPSVTLERKILWRNSKQLIIIYSNYFCNRTLLLDASHTLKIEIDYPDGTEEKAKIRALQDCPELEDYLFGLEYPFAISDVCDEIFRILGFTLKDTLNSKKISIPLNEIINFHEQSIEKILIISKKSK